MSTHAANFTGRYRAHYIAAGVQHSILIRAPRGADLATVITNGQNGAAGVFAPTTALLADDFAWLSAEVALEDTEIFDPAPTPSAVLGTVDFATGNWSARKRVSGLTFSGRSAGSRARFTLYGLDINGDLSTDIGANGIITVAEFSAIDGIVTSANTHNFAGNGEPASFYRRGTHKVNDKLLKLVRRGFIG